MSTGLIIGISFGYLALLFAMAWWTERSKGLWRRWANSPYAYALSLAVYCTAWTYFGSIGNASTDGLSFLAIYIGPTLMVPLWWFVLRKMIRIAKVQRLTSVADFISSRFGKNNFLGGLVAVLTAIGIIPYISLQIKAIAQSFVILTQFNGDIAIDQAPGTLFTEAALYISIILAFFSILFGTRKVEANLRKEGLVSTIAFESIVKLVAFLVVGIVICYQLFPSMGSIFSQASAQLADYNNLISIQYSGYGNWFLISMLSMLAIILLPRQFQMAVVENYKEQHLKKAMWLFPLYLLVINIFVLPIALAGKLTFPGMSVDSDTYLLSIPLFFGQNSTALLAYIGGLSAATSMIIVSTIALSTMLSNNLITPLRINLFRMQKQREQQQARRILLSRRVAILIIIALAYLYYYYLSYDIALLSIGITSFIAVAQFAPALLVGLYWKGATRQGVVTGIVAGFVLWFFLLIIPGLESIGVWPTALTPQQLFGIQVGDGANLTYEATAFFASLFVNMVGFVGVSLFTKPTSLEASQAELFVDIFTYSRSYEDTVIWRGKASYPDLRNLLVRFLGQGRTIEALQEYAKANQLELEDDMKVDARLVGYVESLLAGAIGAASARTMVSSVVQEEEITIDEVVRILKESQAAFRLSRILRQKSKQLEEATQNLREANTRLQQFSDIKDEFLYTVTHELRTPLTSIRAIAEILEDNPDLEEAQRQEFIRNIAFETHRLSRLISNVLDLEKFESGSQQLHRERLYLKPLIEEAIRSVQQLLDEKSITLQVDYRDSLVDTYADRDRIAQVLVNLLSNAIKYCPPDNGKIEVTAYRLDDTVKVNVQDNGPGISKEEQALIFDKFYQVRNQTRKKPKGSGLGLAICKNIIEMHKGSIWVSSPEGQGARLSFTLPVYIDSLHKATT